MIELESTSIIISIISALIGVGFTIGLAFGRYQTKERCEQYRICMEKDTDEKINRTNKELLDSIIRIHKRLDKLIDKEQNDAL